jgi:hypothetical protein
MPAWLADLLGREWFLGVLGGIAATVIGFFLAILWDLYKVRTEGRERRTVAVVTIREQLQLKRKAIERDVNIVGQELQVLGENKSVVQPLSLLRTAFWDVGLMSFAGAAAGPKELVKLREAVFLAEQANEEIRSRESYRIQNGAMSNFAERMSGYDNFLLKTLQELDRALVACEASLPKD